MLVDPSYHGLGHRRPVAGARLLDQTYVRVLREVVASETEPPVGNVGDGGECLRAQRPGEVQSGGIAGDHQVEGAHGGGGVAGAA